MRRHRPPRQARSRKTLDRLVDGTEALLEAKHFDELTVVQIAKHAASSVGAFYGRFKDKQALLHYLDERMEQDAVKHWDAFFDAERWRGATVSDVLREFASVSVKAHRRRKGVLRTVFLRLRSRADAESRNRARRLNEHVVTRATQLLLARRSGIGHPEPESAVRFALFQFGAALREAVLFEDLGLFPLRLKDAELVEALTWGLCSFLRVKRVRHNGGGPRR